jgi:PKD repeat protein
MLIGVLLFTNYYYSQCGCNKIVIIVDNSGSMSSTEFTDLKKSIDSISSKLLKASSNSKLAIVQYGSQNATNHSYHIAVPFTDSISIATNWQRAFATGGIIQPTYYQDHLPGSLSKMRRDSLWEIGQPLDLITDSCKTSFIIFTDAAYGGSGCCSHLINNYASLAPLAMLGFGEYNYLKSTYSSRFATYHVSFGTGSTAQQAGAAISSVGGSYTGAISANLGDPEGSGVSPRIYFPNLTFVIPPGTCSQIINNVLKSAQSIVLDSVCLGDSTSFIVPGTFSYNSSKWNFGDGNTDTTNVNTKHKYAASGTYAVSFIFQISGSSCFDTITDSVIVFPQINSNYNTVITCAGLSTVFTAASTGTYQTVSWDFGDGSFSSNFPTTSHVYTLAGTYNTSLSLTSSGSCSDSTLQTIIIKDISSSVRKTPTRLSTWDTTASYQWLDCDAAYAILPGDTNWYFVPVAHGRYAVEVKKYGCVDTSSCLSFVVLGIDEITENEFTLFPNPVDGELTIFIKYNFSKASIKIFDAQGRLVLVLNTNRKEIKLDVSSLKKGVYFVELNQENHKRTRKFIKD